MELCYTFFAVGSLEKAWVFITEPVLDTFVTRSISSCISHGLNVIKVYLLIVSIVAKYTTIFKKLSAVKAVKTQDSRFSQGSRGHLNGQDHCSQQSQVHHQGRAVLGVGRQADLQQHRFN